MDTKMYAYSFILQFISRGFYSRSLSLRCRQEAPSINWHLSSKLRKVTCRKI